MTRFVRLASGLLLGGSVLFFAGGANARIVCIGDDCWHPKEAYEYPSRAGVVVHEDDWAPGPSVRWREHEGRGYWRGSEWEDF